MSINQPTRARANFSIGELKIELEGSESFVNTHLSGYQDLIVERLKEQKISTEKTAVQEHQSTRKNSKSVAKSTHSDGKKNKPKKAMKISAERFDMHGNADIPSLTSFITEKKPGKPNAEKIAVIGYYISEILGEERFNEGQIEYAYKMLDFPRPTHLHQILINAKNEKDWFEPAEEAGVWTITRAADIFVSDDLPRVEEEQLI